MFALTGDEEALLRKVRLFSQANYPNLLKQLEKDSLVWEFRLAAILSFAKSHCSAWIEPDSDCLSDWLALQPNVNSDVVEKMATLPRTSRLLIADFLLRNSFRNGHLVTLDEVADSIRKVTELSSIATVRVSKHSQPSTNSPGLESSAQRTYQQWVEENLFRVAWKSTASSASHFHSRDNCKLLVEGRIKYGSRDIQDRVRFAKRIISAPIGNLLGQGLEPCKYCFSGEWLT